MTIRLFCNATGQHALACLDRLRELAGDELECVTLLGDVGADLVTVSLAQMGDSRAEDTPLAQGPAHSDADLSLLAEPDFLRAMQATVDRLRQTDPGYRYSSKNLVNLQDYLDYYHILSDIMAQKLLAARSTHVMFLGLPKQVFDRVLYDVARALGIKTVILSPSPFPNLSFSLRQIGDLGDFDPNTGAATIPIERGLSSDVPLPEKAARANRLQGLDHFLSYVLARKPLWSFNPVSLARTLLRMQRQYGSFPNWRDPFARFFGVSAFAYFDYLLETEKQPFDWNRKFVYAPLPGTTSPLGDREPVQAIEDLSLVLPPDWLIYVQETSAQSASDRGPMAFHRLKRIPKVLFISRQTDRLHLIQRSQFVADITCTLGWDAVRNGKPAVVFGPTWFNHLPGVCSFSPDMDPLKVLATPIAHEDLQRATGALVSRGHEGLVLQDGERTPVDFDPVRNADSVARAVLGLLREEFAFTFGD